MTRHRFLLIVVIGALVLMLGSDLWAGAVIVSARPAPRPVVSRHVGLGAWIGAPAGARIHHPPMHRRGMVTGPWRHRFVRLGPSRHRTIVVQGPTIRHMAVRREPVVTVRSSSVHVDAGTITVWVRNSNGSKTSVRLSKHGSSYVGPRGEWYTSLPSNERLRVIYGF
jgi:hypothetical protein